MTAEDIACQEFVELVTDYVEGALDPSTLARFERHVADCPSCLLFVEQIRATIQLAGAAGRLRVPPGAQAHLLEAFRGWHRLER